MAKSEVEQWNSIKYTGTDMEKLCFIRDAASQDLLLEIIRTDRNTVIQQGAVIKLTDEEALAKIVLLPYCHPLTKKAALKKIYGTEVLTRIIRTTRDEGVKFAAIYSLRSTIALANVLQEEKDEDLKKVITKRIQDLTGF